MEASTNSKRAESILDLEKAGPGTGRNAYEKTLKNMKSGEILTRSERYA